MRRSLRILLAHDGIYLLAVFATIAVAISLWLTLTQPMPQTSTHEHTSYTGTRSQKPAYADVPRTTPFVSDYTPPVAVNGLAPIITKIETTQKVVFLTIDDGAYKDPSVIAAMEKYHLKASLFLAKLFIASDPGFFAKLKAGGSQIEDHTLSHDLKMTKDMSYAQQRAEICGMADYEMHTYGRRPYLYRPPGGSYTDVMRRAAHDCDMKAVVTWMVTINNGTLRYQVGNTLRPGDIVLMHFRPTFTADIEAFVTAAKSAGLTPELLEDAIPPV